MRPRTIHKEEKKMKMNEEEKYGKRKFESEKELIRLLQMKTPADFVSVRPGPSNTSLKYLEGTKAIEIANAIFGYDGWAYEIKTLVSSVKPSGGQYYAMATATVRVTLQNGVYREDLGAGSSLLKFEGVAKEMAGRKQ